jgi:hypothetical protein
VLGGRKVIESGRFYWLFPCQGSASSRPVAIANRIVARTAFMSGVHFLLSDGDFPPR